MIKINKNASSSARKRSERNGQRNDVPKKLRRTFLCCSPPFSQHFIFVLDNIIATSHHINLPCGWTMVVAFALVKPMEQWAINEMFTMRTRLKLISSSACFETLRVGLSSLEISLLQYFLFAFYFMIWTEHDPVFLGWLDFLNLCKSQVCCAIVCVCFKTLSSVTRRNILCHHVCVF